jgi:putative transposase
VCHAQATLSVSGRRASRVVGQCRATQQYVPTQRDDEDRLRARIIVLAHEYGRYGYRRITALLQQEGWRANHKRVERLWRQEGLTGPQKQPKRARLWLADGSCIRRRAEYPNHVWSYDFVMDRTQDGRPLKMLTVVDAYTPECLAIAVRRRLTSREVQEVLSELFLHRDCPTHIRSDNGPECIARALRAW